MLVPHTCVAGQRSYNPRLHEYISVTGALGIAHAAGVRDDSGHELTNRTLACAVKSAYGERVQTLVRRIPGHTKAGTKDKYDRAYPFAVDNSGFAAAAAATAIASS